MEPKTQHETTIANAVSAKAKAIAEGQGNWGDNIVTEMKVAVPFEMNEGELAFLEQYVAWKRDHPES